MDLRTLAAGAIVQSIRLPEIERCGIEWCMLRLDSIDTTAAGNKLFKLAENFRFARAAGHRRLLSFGGAFSNHLHALALLGAAEGFATIGVVRGEAVAAHNPTLRDAQQAGMTLHFVDRETYRRKHEVELMADLQRRFGPCYIIPEGGANTAGVAGCRILGQVIREQVAAVDTVVLPCATGSTLAGVVAGIADHCATLGVAVLKGGGFLPAVVQDHLQAADAAHNVRWRIVIDEHCGGYARTTPALMAFIEDFQRRSGIPLEPVYTGKMMYALYRRILASEFATGTRVLALHTGGLQGARGFVEWS
ncbi:MAG TPA: pyridoxal-phosphate dependent enzyme [Spongiibacteraceae bacterium]|nr:pyridoxal-phosphate dependent enzyme [Spongiibacteraceae bacterium]